MGSTNGDTPDTEIGVKELTKTFGSQTVWEDMTCDIPKGKITVMLGPSGTGKSVFLKHIMGLLKPDHGEIWIDDKNIPSLSERELYKVRRKFGVLFQDGALFGSMSVYDNTAFPLREHTKKGEKEIKQIVTEKLEMVGLQGAEKTLPGDITGGGDGDGEARSSRGMSAEETEEMERSAGAPDEGEGKDEGENVRRLERGDGDGRGNGYEAGSPFEQMFTDGSEEEQA